MNVDHILETMNRHGVEYLLIGGMNFFIRHRPVATFDVDLWIADSIENRRRCEAALAVLSAEWGASEKDWGPVSRLEPDWLNRHGLFCLTSPSGDLDIFRSVKGLPEWSDCRRRAAELTTAAGIPFRALSDQDMLDSQLALPEGERHLDRIRILKDVLRQHGT